MAQCKTVIYEGKGLSEESAMGESLKKVFNFMDELKEFHPDPKFVLISYKTEKEKSYFITPLYTTTLEVEIHTS